MNEHLFPRTHAVFSDKVSQCGHAYREFRRLEADYRRAIGTLRHLLRAGSIWQKDEGLVINLLTDLGEK